MDNSARAAHHPADTTWRSRGADTPGVRDVAPWDADEGVAEAYSDLDDLAATCRFTRCRHETEPGCALRGAWDSGELDSERFAGWRRLLSEQETRVRLREQRDVTEQPKRIEEIRPT